MGRSLRRRAITLTIALLMAALVASLTIDLGPSLRELAERQASKQLKRTVRFGRLSIHLIRGRVLLEDFSIGGVAAGDRPFFVARHLSLGLDWSTAFKRVPEITITSVELTDWNMLVERWEDHTSFPKFVDDDDRPKGPRRFTTTLKYLRAWRGQFVYEDHQVPWSVTAPNIDLDITNLPKYHGNAVFKGGVVQIQNDLPMWVNFKTAFSLDGPRVHLEQMDLKTDGAETVASGDVDFAHWPEQLYHVKSVVHFQRMREIFWKDEKWALTGDGDFNGTFRLYKGGHDLSGSFTSREAGVNGLRFPKLYGALRWSPQAFEVWDAGAGFFGGAAQFGYSIKPLGQPTRPTARFDATISGSDLAAFTDTEQLAGVRFGGAASGHILIEWPLGRGAERTGSGNFSVAPPLGVTLAGASLDSSATGNRREWGPFAPSPLPAHLPIGGELTFQFDPEKVEFTSGRFNTEQTHDIPGPDGLGIAGPHRVSRHQPRLAGERRGAGGDHDRLWRQHRSRGVRRPRGVRRRDDGSLQGTPCRRRFQRHGSLGLGHGLGQRRRPHRCRKQVRGRPERCHSPRRFGDSC